MNTKKKSAAGIVVIILILIIMRFFSIVELPIPSLYISYLTYAFAIFIYCYTFKGRKRIGKKYPFIGKYFTYIVFAQIILCAYSMIKYNETILDMIVCISAYSLLLITYAILISFERDGMKFLLDAIFWIMFINTILASIHAVVLNYTGVRLFGFVEMASKNENVRIGLGALMSVFLIYAFYNLINKKRMILMSIALAIGIFALFYVSMTRASQFATIASLFVVWAFHKNNGRKDMIKYIIIGVLLVIFFNSSIYTNILNVFSIDPNVNEHFTSTEARYNAIDYFSQFTDANPIMGMGWVVPKNEELTKIWSGKSGTNYFDDLGVLGQYYRQGLLGLAIFIILIIRMLYTTIKIRKGIPEKAFCVGLCAYVLLTAVSQNTLDGQRMITVPFYIACTEYIYYKQKTDMLLLKRKETDALNNER